MFDPVNHQLRRRGAEDAVSVVASRAPRSPLGAHPPPGRRRRRRADARDARPDVQPDLEVLRGADPAEGQRRRVRRRRLRPAAHSAARPAEPLDRAARKPRRLPDAAHRARSSRSRSTSSSCSRRTSSRSRSPTKRSCAASRTRSWRRIPTLDEFCQIFELNCRRRGMAFDPVMVEYLNRKYYQPRRLQMRACHPRDLVEQVVDMLPLQRSRAGDHARAARRGVRQLLPRRDRITGSREEGAE